MPVLKGYSNEAKLDRTQQKYVTVQPISPQQHGLDTVPQYVEQIGTDTVEASSSTSVLNLTAHAALVGDLIRFTSGALSGRIVRVVETATNTVTLGETLPSDPSTLNIAILRHRPAYINSSGELTISGSFTPSPTLFTLDGSNQEVTEDTITPANNRPLPTKIVNASGDVSVATEGTLSSLNAKVTAVNTGAVVVSSSALPAGAATEATLASVDGKITAVDTGNVTIVSSALPSGAATEATLASIDGKITAVNTGAVVVSSSALPSGAATEATLASIDGKITAVNTGAVTISSALPSGTNTIGNVNLNYLDVVDFIDTTPILDTSSTNIPASASSPLTIVASLAAAVKKVQFLDTTGSFIGLYSDPAGSPVLEAVFGPGSDQTIEVAIPAATVLGLRNMENSAISSGIVSINFIG